MNLASPERLAWLLIGVPIILMYLLRTRLRRQPVATLLFWDQLFDEKRQRSWWQRLRHWLSLLLQLAFLLLLVGALVDPLWTGQRDTARQVVIVLDNSASMSAATQQGSTRFEQARQEAIQIASALRDGDEIALVSAGSVVRVVVGMTDFAPAIRDALEQLELTDGPSRVVDAVETARRLTQSPRRQVMVISDACFSGAADLIDQDDIHLVSVGEPVNNVGITSLAVRRSLIDPIGYAALIEIENFGDQQTDFRLTIDLDDELVDVIPVTLAPDEVWTKTIDGVSAAGGVLRVRADLEDAMQLDNQAWAVLPQRPRIPVQLVTAEPSLYLEGVLSAIPLIDLTITSTPPTQSPPGGFTLLHRIVPDLFPSGSVMVIDPRGDSDVWKLGRRIDQAIIATQETKSPLMPHVRLTNVIVPGARDLEMIDGATPLLIDADGATLMASLVRGDDRIVVLAADLDSGDLPLRIAFPVLMTNAVNWFLGQTDAWQPSLRTGELAKVSRGPVPPGELATEPWAWRDASGHVSAASVTDEMAVVGPMDRVGLAQLGPRQQIDAAVEGDDPPSSAADASTSSPSRRITLAVNLCNRDESDLRPRVEVVSQGSTLAGSGRRSPWFYLAALGLGLVAGEWFLYQRRIVG